MAISNKRTNNKVIDEIFIDATKKELDNIAEIFYTDDTLTIEGVIKRGK